MGKIDLSKLSGALKRLGALRAYTALLWPVLIVVASALIMTAALMMGSSFKQKVEKESVPLANQVKKLLDNSVPAGQAEVEGRYEGAYREDANKIARLAEESTKRELLAYDIFPEPKEASALLFTRYGNRFCQQIDGLITKVHGRDCPSEEELSVNLQKSTGAVMTRMPGRVTGTDGSDTSRITDEICQARAKAASVYVNPGDISGYDFWEQYKYTDQDTGVKDCWYWQVGYWIIGDVFSTAGALNAGSSSVYDSPVKRIMRVGFEIPGKLLSPSEKGVVQEKPRYVIKSEDPLTETCTGRFSNSKIDVVHFGIVAVVRTKDIMSFMDELCSVKEHSFKGYTGQEDAAVFKHNQISILESQIKSIDLTSKQHRYYRYGPDSVVEVDLVCEYIFNKNGYEAIKPKIVNSDVEPKKK
jgi:hypothetical protein